MILETKRLFLRRWTQEDFADLAEMLQDPEVMYAYEHDFSDDDVRAWLNRQLARYEKDGFGLFAAVRKEDGVVVGQAGITWQDPEGEPVLEIGYHLKRRYWHMGYAAEAALGCRDYAFSALNAPEVFSIIKSDNFASQKVAERMGMRKRKEFTVTYYAGEMLHYLYGVSRQEANN